LKRELFRKLAVHYLGPHLLLPPGSVFISPTLRCSSRCTHCGVWKLGGRAPEMKASQWARLLEDPYLSGVRTLWISGGEPTLRSDLDELAIGVADSLRSLTNITIATSGLHPARLESYLENALPFLEARGIYSWIHLSLDGPPEIHDRVRGVEGAFNLLERTVSILRRFAEKSSGPGWGFNCVITPVNAGHLAETRETARRLGGDITFNLPAPEEGFYRGEPELKLSGGDKSAVVAFLNGLIEEGEPCFRRHYETLLAVLEGKGRKYRCETLEATLYIDPDGTAYPCPVVYEDFRVRVSQGRAQWAWKKLARYKRWIRRGRCEYCALGCSFGEGLTFSEFLRLRRAPGR